LNPAFNKRFNYTTMNYFYKFFYYKWFLRNHRNDVQIVKQETEFWKSNSQQWLTKLFTNRDSRKAQEKIGKLREEANKLDAFLVTRDHNGIETAVPLPILTPEEQIRVNRGKRRHLFLIMLLSAIDTFLFSLIAVYFMPPESGYGSKLIFGLIAALSIILCWEGGFAGILTFIKDKNLYRKGKLDTLQLSYAKLALGILLLIVAVGLSIAIGIVRMHLLEGANTGIVSAISTEARNNVRAAGNWASAASMIFAFLTGILLGFSRIMTDTFSEKGAMYNDYKAMCGKIAGYRKDIDNYDKERKNDTKHHIESHWKMILYIRSVLRRDFDEEDRPIAMNLKEARKQKGFEYDATCYHEFQDVQCMDEQLFKFGILNSDACVQGQQQWERLMAEYREITAHVDLAHKVDNKPSVRTLPHVSLAKTAVLTVLIATTISFTGCRVAVHKPVNLTAFVDWSNSLPELTEEFYVAFIYKLMTYLKPGDHLRVLPIDKNTESGSVELVDIIVPPAGQFSSPFDPPAQKNEMAAFRFKKFQDSVIRVLKAGVIELKKRNLNLKQGTDIFGALRVAQAYFDPSKVNVLILCSDMLNYSPELKMEKVKLDNRFISAALTSLNHHFKNTKYFGLYCITGPNDQLSPEVFEGAKAFWCGYFRGASIPNVLYVSGETSVIEDKLRLMQNQDTTVTQSFF
jgi:hypothetical protein